MSKRGSILHAMTGAGDLRFRGAGDVITESLSVYGIQVIRSTGEFWTARQRQGSSLHEVSYRGCFKPQLPAYFINLLTKPSDLVYDPFSGRGTTVIEAGLLGRAVAANDANPLSRLLTRPRFFLPDTADVKSRLEAIPIDTGAGAEMDLSMFFHPGTEAEISSLRNYLLERERDGDIDHVDDWIRMVATNRLTGHSSGFFSVYTLPPNQAVSPMRQIRINQKRDQVPPYRDTRALILKKTLSLLKDVSEIQKERLRKSGENALFLSGDSRRTPGIGDGTVQLTITSPPFLDVVQYSSDNWLRCWFNGIDPGTVEKNLTVTRSLPDWRKVMQQTLYELFRVTRSGGHIAFEVGEVKGGTVRLDETVVPLGVRAGFSCEGILVNLQDFTKTSHIWGIGNNAHGTNTNRIVVFKKEG
ncbi:MAG: DNA methylase [Methanoregulaceae archaeon PtaB.Bin009]|nr:MAG: DNA methylase [Methanoregulaceae archaeon PtaB.Bin009]OPY42065.1 MAG: DNA methylase [Methanoregulaceae archaeon PtaU1.Bin066]